MKQHLLTGMVIFYVLFSWNTSFAQCNPFVKVSFSYRQSGAIKKDGTLWTWGWNFYGQLGDGTKDNKLVPTQVGTEQWEQVSFGHYHTIAIKKDGTLWAWGLNDIGQLGNGTTVSSLTPTQIGTDNNWQHVNAFFNTSYAIKSDGTLWTWGSNATGQLGNGLSGGTTRVPTQVGTDANWQQISSGYFFALGLKKDGTLWAWGDNKYGQLGDSTILSKYQPIQVGTDKNWKLAAAGFRFSMAIKTDGSLWAWGQNNKYQLGDGTNINKLTPTRIGFDNDWTQIVGSDDVRALKSDGTLWTWGRGTSNPYANSSSPIKFGTSSNWVAIGVGQYATSLLQTDGSLWTFGNDPNGELGNGSDKTSHLLPTQIYNTFYNDLAEDESSQTAQVSEKTTLGDNCDPIASLELANSTDVVTATVWTETEQPKYYVKRHYEITPETNPDNTSGTITLYFSNQDFKDFNATEPELLLPDIDDPATVAARKANVKIEKISGTSSDDSGSPESYTGSTITIDPDDKNIIWNELAARWEITFNVKGFSGFFMKTQAETLPVTFGNISAILKNEQLNVNWSTINEINNSHFEIQASTDGKNFITLKNNIYSKAKNGNSDIAIHYQVSMEQQIWKLVLGASLLAMFGFTGFVKNKNRKLLPLAILITLITVVAACKKTDLYVDNANQKLFIRITQIDYDGTKKHSKIVQVLHQD